MPLVLAIFFMTLGYLEAGPIGIVVGLIAYLWASVLINFSLIPFLGALIWWYITIELLKNLQRYVLMDDIIQKIFLVFGFQAVFYCLLTSVATLLLICLIIKLWKNRKKFFELKRKFMIQPSDTWSEIEIKRKANELQKLNLNMKLVGSALFFLGLGIANHDFIVELKENKVNPFRPHGISVGLALATFGVNLIEISLRKKLYFYIGLVVSYIAFWTLSILPKGLRFISGVLWYLGNSLMVYNWYLLVKDELFNENEIQNCLGEVYK